MFRAIKSVPAQYLALGCCLSRYVTLARYVIISPLLCLGWVSLSFAQNANWQDITYIEESFYEIALGNEYSDEQSTLRKWEGPLLVYVDHGVGDDSLHLQLLTMHLDHLESITQLLIEYVDTKDQANLVVYMTGASEIDELIKAEIGAELLSIFRGAVCLAHFRQNSSSVITQAVVIIPVDRARLRGKLISCFVEELTQVLGLPNDSKEIFPTVFSDRTVDELLTGLDYLLLKLLYSPMLEIGMNEVTLAPIIQQQLIQWQQDGTIDNAQQEVMKGELYYLTGYR